MAKEKLKKFSDYCSQLLPHEIVYLNSRFKSVDKERRSILDHVYQQINAGEDAFCFDASIDKRKYSKVLQWMQLELSRKDVDLQLERINFSLRAILLDNVPGDIDQEILKLLKSMKVSNYYFMYFYEMLLQYRHYLLIRMRYQVYQKVNDYIEKWQFDYKRTRLVFEQMHQATFDIIGTGEAVRKEAIQWSKWLLENFRNDGLDGLNRNMAAIRYIFICLRYNALDELELLLNELDVFFKNGQNYSKRLLVNFYDNMLVLHDQKESYEEARRYGYLSIKYDHPDAIIYRNNLINVLIKMNRFAEALSVIEAAKFKLKNTRNFHSAIGFISNHIRCLTRVDKNNEAIIKGNIFMRAYISKILKYRWHRFFAAYHGALLSDKKFAEIIKNTEKHNLDTREKQQISRKKYKLILNLYYLIAQRNMGLIGSDELKDKLSSFQVTDDFRHYDDPLRDVLVNAL